MTAAAHDLRKVVDRLCGLSREAFANPYTSVEWPETIDPGAWCMSPELVSLHGSPAWESLDEAARKKLAFWECVNFFSLNIHGEKALVEGLTRRLYAREMGEVSPYLHHFVDEENKHMFYFGTFCGRYAGKTYPDKKLALGEPPEKGADFLFFLKVAIFEEIVDVYNVRMARDARLAPVVRTINSLHHQDETRHLAFGRVVVEKLFAELAARSAPEELAATRAYAAEYLRATWREYYSPDVYRDAGVPDPYRVHREVVASDAARAHRREVSQKCVRWLLQAEILTTEPAP
jgi:hypothetical protein